MQLNAHSESVLVVFQQFLVGRIESKFIKKKQHLQPLCNKQSIKKINKYSSTINDY